VRLGFDRSALLVACVLAPLLAVEAKGQNDPVVALVNATVVDVERGVLVPNQSIITSRGRIEHVGPAASTKIPRGATRVDLRGAFVIPGLWDMHVHIARDAPDIDALVGYYGSLFLRHGVTSVRDAGGNARRLAAMDSVGASRPAAMPRILYSGAKIGPGKDQTFGSAEIRAAISERLQAGARFVKLAPAYPVDLLKPTLDACAAAAVMCVAHIPDAETALWLSAPGRGSFEHLFNLPEQVSRVPAADLFAAIREFEAPTLLQRVLYKLRLRRRPLEPEPQRIAMRDTGKDPEFFGRVAASGTWFTPTLLLHQYMTRAVDVIPSSIDPQLTLTALPSIAGRSAETTQTAKDSWSLWNGVVRAMSAANVNLLAGTDFFGAHVPGAALHAELVLLQQAGVPAPVVLRMATVNPARYLGAADSLGTVAPGRVADLVVLRRNPLEDVGRIAEVEMVMTRGHLLRREALDSLANAARAAAGRLRAHQRSGQSRSNP